MVLLLASFRGEAACGNGSPTITNVPSLGGSLYWVSGLNSAGQIVGYSYLPGDLEQHAFLSGPSGAIDLGSLGGSSSQGFALNNLGQVAGESTITDDLASRAFLYNGSMADLGTLGGSFSSARAINDSGQVAGNAGTTGDMTLEAFRTSNGMLMGLGSLGSGFSTAVAINQAGNVVGTSLTEVFDSHAYLHDGNEMIDLGTLGGSYSAAFALNDNNVVVGESTLANGETRGFVYSGGVMTDVGTLGGNYSSASSINNSGQIIGTAALPGDEQVNGFLYSAGTMTDLGTLGGSYSLPHAINASGQVVGQSETGDFEMRAFLWQNGSMIDLNTLLPLNSGWVLNSATFINDSGRIVGRGTFNDQPQWFILDLGGANSSPVANAGTDQSAQCGGQVTLDGTQSSDPDGDALSYQWSEGAMVLGSGPTLTVTLGDGTHTITLTVTDPCGDSDQDTVVIQVSGDTTPPTITCPGTVASAGSGTCETIVPDLRQMVVVSDNCTPVNELVITQSPAPGTVLGSGQYGVTVTVTDSAGNAASCTTAMTVGDSQPPVIVRSPRYLTVSTGRDCEGEVPSMACHIVARDNCTRSRDLVITQSPEAGTQLPKGEHLIAVTVTDASGNSTTKHVSLRVVDRTPPKIHAATATPEVLTPADGTKVLVKVSVTATDNCDEAPASRIVRVLCDERTAPGDIKVMDDLSVRLAASRSSRGNGRVYKIIILCRDSSGNPAFESVTVRVPKSGHNAGNGKH